MKKYLTVAATGLLLVSTPSFANNAQKINLVKKVNASVGKLSSEEAIYKYADSGLKQAIRPALEAADAGYMCPPGADIRIQAQDWDNPKFTYSVNNQGLVVVKVRDMGMTSTVKYKLSGSAGNYKISDVIYNGGTYKQELKGCQ